MALAPQAENVKRIFTPRPLHPSTLIIVVFEEQGGRGAAWCQGHPISPLPPLFCQTQRTGTNAWHSGATNLPTATLATIDSEGSVRGESSLTNSKHRNTLHAVQYALPRAATANIISWKLQTKIMSFMLSTGY